MAIPISISFSVSVTGGGTGGGAINSNPAGINCIVPDPAADPGGLNRGDCFEAYVVGARVTLAATPDPGSVFAGWSGDCTGAGSCVLTVGANKQVAATFNRATRFALVVNRVGGGTVTSNPLGINCGADCTETYAVGTRVTLTATPATGFKFTGWSGACTGTGNCVVVMSQVRNVIATFAQSFALTVAKAGSGNGTVTSTPAGINCGSDCSEAYTANTVVTLKAVADSGSTFAGWSGACTGASSCVVTMTAAKSVTATFNPVSTNFPDLVVPVLSSPPASNVGRTVSFTLQVKNQGQAAAGAFKVGLYLSKDQVINLADVKTGFECSYNSLGVGITTACSGSFNLPKGLATGVYYLGAYADPYNVIKETNKSNNSRATTNTLTVYNLTVTKVGSGTVTSVPPGINCGSDCVAAFLAGATATLTATPASGQQFKSWTGCTTVNGATCTVKMDAAKTVKAAFGL